MKSRYVNKTPYEETAYDCDTYLIFKVKQKMYNVQKAMEQYPEFKEAVDKFFSKQMTREEFTPFARKYVTFMGKLVDYSKFGEDGKLKK